MRYTNSTSLLEEAKDIFKRFILSLLVQVITVLSAYGLKMFYTHSGGYEVWGYTIIILIIVWTSIVFLGIFSTLALWIKDLRDMILDN